MLQPVRRAASALLITAQVWFIATTFATHIEETRTDLYRDAAFDYVLKTSFYVGAIVAVVAGLLLWDRQPRNGCGPILVLLGLAMTSFYSFQMRVTGEVPPDSHLEHVLLLGGVALLRPVLIWLLLAWPTGRMSRVESRLVALFGVIHVTAFFVPQLFYEDSVFSVASIQWLGDVIRLFQFYVITLGTELAVLVVLVRRFRSAPAPVRSLTMPVVIAAALVIIGDIAIPVNDDLLPSWSRAPDLNELKPLGFALLSLDYLRYIAIPVILLVAAARRRGVRGASLTVELGAVTNARSMSALLADSLLDPHARVLYPSGGDWVDAEGMVATLPVADRRLTLVQRDDLVVAAIDHRLFVEPAALEAAASTLSLLVEHRALDALTNERLHELRRVRSTVLDTEDAIRRRLERDLHDGAQQQILALALHTQLAEGLDGVELATEIERVRNGLLRIAEGVTEQVIAERGLTSFLEALTATSPVPAELSGTVPDVLAPPIAATAWFVASEAVGNAVKHSLAARLVVDVRQAGQMLRVAVSDNGCGGADPHGGGLSGLARRVRDIVGELSVQSPRGAGTLLVASLPLGMLP